MNVNMALLEAIRRRRTVVQAVEAILAGLGLAKMAD